MTNNQEDLIFAIDLGGTSAKTALANFNGEITHKFTIKTSYGDEVIPNLKAGLDQELAKLNISYDCIKAIGFSCKGPFDDHKGVIINAGDIGFFNYPARDIAEKIFQKPVILTNDSRSAAVGEWKQGAGQKYQSFICLTLGKGIGSGIILGNQLWQGAHNLAGEIGHGGFMQNKYICGCKLKHCCEASSSAIGIEKDLNDFAKTNPVSSLGKLREKQGGEFTLKQAATLIKNDDPDAQSILKEALRPLASRISLAIFFLDVEAVLIGGGPSELGDKLLDPIKELVAECTWQSTCDQTDFKVCELKNDAGIIGTIEWTLLKFLKN